jgi:hypothetical protein
MAPPNRKGGGGLSLQTLVIASAASVTAAMVTSRVAPAGTIYASALTPVIVAAVSEVLNKPADRVSAFRDERRAMVREARRAQTARVLGEEPNPLRGAPDFAQGPEADEEHGFVTAANGNGHGADEALERIRRLGGTPRRRILHPKVWIATGLAAFAIAVALLTLPELIFGGAVATNHRTTIFGGGATHQTSKPKTEKQQTKPTTSQQTSTTTVPTDSSTTPATTETTPTTTGEQTAPSGGTPAPQSTDTQTTPTTTGATPTP